MLRIVSGSAEGRGCTVRPSEAPPGLAAGDVLAVVVPRGRPGECVLVSTLEASSAFLWAFTSMIVAILLAAFLMALVVHRRQREAVPGAEIRCDVGPRFGSDRVRSTLLDGVSDSDGQFEFVAPYDGEARLSVIPREHCMKFVSFGEKRGNLGEIRLTSGVEISGIIRDAKGSPMPNARLVPASLRCMALPRRRLRSARSGPTRCWILNSGARPADPVPTPASGLSMMPVTRLAPARPATSKRLGQS